MWTAYGTGQSRLDTLLQVPFTLLLTASLVPLMPYGACAAEQVSCSLSPSSLLTVQLGRPRGWALDTDMLTDSLHSSLRTQVSGSPCCPLEVPVSREDSGQLL